VTAPRDRPTEFTRAIRAELKHRIADQGLTRKQIAQATGHTAATIHRWLDSERPLRVTSVEEICAAIGVEPRQVIADAEVRMPPPAAQPVK
jgi:predicted transcriptional regulator